MDPIEKKFQEAFADYQLPVDDGLWDQVLEKKNRRKPFPWMRLAAAITLLLLAGVLLWPEQSTPPTEIVETSTQMTPETTVNPHPLEPSIETESQSLETHPTVPQERRNQEATPLVVQQKENTPVPSDQEEFMDHELKAEFADLPQLHRKPLQHVRHTSAPVALPMPNIQWSPIKTTDPSAIADVPVTQQNKRTQTDVTGPARLVNVLEKNSPKLVKDIIAFGSAPRTEIEINW